MTIPEAKAEIVTAVHHLKGCLARLQRAYDSIAGDANLSDLRRLIDAKLLVCNGRLDAILRERSRADH